VSEELEIIEAPKDGNLLQSLDEAVLSLSADSPKDTLLEFHERMKFYKQESTRMLKIVEQAMISFINAHGPIELGNGVRYYVAHPKDTKCNNVAQTVEAIFEATGGDFVRSCECLSTSAIKHGAAKKILPPEKFEELFTVTVKDKLETGEAAPKKLQKADDRFAR
jgi:hypothetical protein